MRNNLEDPHVVLAVRARRVLLWLMVAAVLLLMLLFAAGTLFCNATMHVPRRAAPDPGRLEAGRWAAEIATVRITAYDGAQLEGWFLRSRSAGRGCVLILHGIGDSRAGSVGFAPLFLEAGYSVLVPDSRAHGQSGGEFVTYGLLEKHDVLAWARWLQSAGCTRTYALGESFGGAALIQASAMEPLFRAIVAESAYSDLRSVAQYRIRQTMGGDSPWSDVSARWLIAGGIGFARLRYGFDFDKASPVQAIVQTKAPILLIHGAEDRGTPAKHSMELAAACPRAVLWIVPGAGHCGAAAAAPEEFRRRVLEWFADH